MRTPNEVYAVTQDYIHDWQGMLGKDLTSTLEGWVRSRSLANLASCDSLWDRNIHGLAEFRHLRQIAAFFKKNAAFSNPEACLSAAQVTFDAAEQKCSLVNKRLDWYYTRQEVLPPDLRSYLWRMEKEVSHLLGDFSTFLATLPSMLRVTSGATSTRSRRESLPFLKVSTRPVATSGAVKYLKALGIFWGTRSIEPRIAEWNRVTFVPKNWKTDRTIACEPEGNLPLQLAFDTYAKRRLKRLWRIDLTNQFRNQEMAREGSICGKYATIDLKAASDSLAYNTVRWLLPERWFQYVNDIRSPLYRLDDGSCHSYSKFSSMGNGATFALETLVFAAACRAVGATDFSVYGDDIVITTEHAEAVIRLLDFLGFSTNTEKSFIEGPFRESCGLDSYEGTDVTPFYLRNTYSQKNMLAHVVNNLAKVGIPGGKLWKRAKAIAQEEELLIGPLCVDDTAYVFVDAPTAYRIGSLRRPRDPAKVGWEPHARAYVVKTKTRAIFGDPRATFLWHLGKAFQPNRDLTCSSVPTRSHKFARKWVAWKPVRVRPDPHIYMWSDYLIG